MTQNLYVCNKMVIYIYYHFIAYIQNITAVIFKGGRSRNSRLKIKWYLIFSFVASHEIQGRNGEV